MTDRPIPKSLHTVTVLVRLAEHVRAESYVTPESALTDATIILGLDDKPDTHGLVSAALRQLKGTSK